MSEKPLHVRVAEALGWTHCYRKTEYTDFEPIETTENWRGFPPAALRHAAKLLESPGFVSEHMLAVRAGD